MVYQFENIIYKNQQCIDFVSFKYLKLIDSCLFYKVVRVFKFPASHCTERARTGVKVMY